MNYSTYFSPMACSVRRGIRCRPRKLPMIAIGSCATTAADSVARDDEGDGVREGHSHTIERRWTGRRNHLRPLRGVHKGFLSGDVAVFE